MPFSTFANNRRRDNDVADGYTFYLHDGDPGANGTANRIPGAVVGGAAVAAGAAQWDVTTDGEATLAADLSFGNAGQAQTGVTWYSVFTDAGDFFARRELAATMNIANGAPVILSSSSIVWRYTSTDN